MTCANLTCATRFCFRTRRPFINAVSIFCGFRLISSFREAQDVVNLMGRVRSYGVWYGGSLGLGGTDRRILVLSLLVDYAVAAYTIRQSDDVDTTRLYLAIELQF